MSDMESGLFAINLADDGDDENDPEAGASATATEPLTPAADRTGQTEEEFQAVRKTYRVKVENGEVSQVYFFFHGFLWLLPLTSPHRTSPRVRRGALPKLAASQRIPFSLQPPPQSALRLLFSPPTTAQPRKPK